MPRAPAVLSTMRAQWCRVVGPSVTAVVTVAAVCAALSHAAQRHRVGGGSLGSRLVLQPMLQGVGVCCQMSLLRCKVSGSVARCRYDVATHRNLLPHVVTTLQDVVTTLQDVVLRCRATLQHGSLTLISTSAASFSVSRLSWLGRRCGLIVLRATRHIARLSRLRHVPCCSPATPATPAGCYAREPTTVKGPPMGRTAAVYRTAIPHGTVSKGGTAASQAGVTGCAGASRGSAACSAGPSATRTSRCRRTGSTYE